jgi:hypothetical protein
VVVSLVAVFARLVNRHGYRDVVALHHGRRKSFRDVLPIGGFQKRGKGQLHLAGERAVFPRLGTLCGIPESLRLVRPRGSSTGATVNVHSTPRLRV